MLDVLIDTLIDALKTLPFLFGAYLIIEFIEHRALKNLLRGFQNSAVPVQ